MEETETPYPILVLLFIPVYIAINKLIMEFNYVDFAYLMLVIIIFSRSFIKTRRERGF